MRPRFAKKYATWPDEQMRVRKLLARSIKVWMKDEWGLTDTEAEIEMSSGEVIPACKMLDEECHRAYELICQVLGETP